MQLSSSPLVRAEGGDGSAVLCVADALDGRQPAERLRLLPGCCGHRLPCLRVQHQPACDLKGRLVVATLVQEACSTRLTELQPWRARFLRSARCASAAAASVMHSLHAQCCGSCLLLQSTGPPNNAEQQATLQRTRYCSTFVRLAGSSG